jgi:hypothetical protein
MKALKRFFGKSGTWYDIGDEIQEVDKKHAPKSFVTKEEKVQVKSPDKVVAKVSTKRGRKPKENKNGKPKTEDK